MGRLLPQEGFGIISRVLCPCFDGGDKVIDRAEDATSESALGEKRELPFDEVQPRRDRLDPVGGEVVEHDIDLEVPWHVEVEQLEEGEHVGHLVRARRIVDDLAGGDVHRRE